MDFVLMESILIFIAGVLVGELLAGAAILAAWRLVNAT